MRVLLLRLVDGSETILTAGRATRTDTGDVAFESVDARGNWSLIHPFKAGQVQAAFRSQTLDDGTRRWVRQQATGRWWTY